MKQYIIFYGIVIIINIIAFLIMGYDKKLAKDHKLRISEKALFTFALFFGGVGIYLGMYTFRHKTKHAKFTVLIPITIILNIIAIYYITTHILPNISI